MTGSNSFHPGKKTLKLTKTNCEKGEVTEDFLAKKAKKEWAWGIANWKFLGTVPLVSESCC